jgi:hypothetical protein
MSRDYLPSNDEKLADMLQIVHDTVNTHLTAWKIDATDLNSWEPELKLFKSALAVVLDPATRTVNATRAKNDARKVVVTKARRFIQGRLIYNELVSPADLLSMGIKPHDTTHTPKPAPTHRPQIELNTTGNHQHTVNAINPVSKKKTKPDDAYGVKTAWGICETPPTNIHELSNSEFSRKTVRVLNYTQEDSGKTAYYAVRYENAKGEGGPWSDIIGGLIP